MNILTSSTATILISAFSVICLTSCGDLEQNLIINADGSGTLETSIDLGEMMSMMNGLGDMGDIMNEDVTISGVTEIESITIDSTTLTADTITIEPKDPMQAIMDKISDPTFDQELDTLIAFMTLMPDSVREKETRPDLLEKVNIRIQSPANSSSLNVGIVINFDDKDQLNEITNHIGTIDGGSSPGMLSGAGGGGGGIAPESFLVFDADIKAGWIRFDTIDYSAFASDMGMQGDSSDSFENMAMLEMMFSNSKIKSVIHVPGEVTSCTKDDAILTKDNKVIVEHDYLDVIRQGIMPGFTIYFTPKK